MAFFWRVFFLLLALAGFFLLPAILFFHPLFLLFSLTALGGFMWRLFQFPEALLERRAPLQALAPEDPWKLGRFLEELKAAELKAAELKKRGRAGGCLLSRSAVCLKTDSPAPFSLFFTAGFFFRSPRIIISESLLDILSAAERRLLLAWGLQAASSGGAALLTLVSRLLRFLQFFLSFAPLGRRFSREDKEKTGSAEGFLFRLVFLFALRGAGLLTRPVFLKLDQLAAGGEAEKGRQIALLLWKLRSLSQTGPAPLPLFFAPLSPVCLLAGLEGWHGASLHPPIRERIKALGGSCPL